MYNNYYMQNGAMIYENTKLTEKKDLRKLGTLAGSALLLFVTFQLICVLAISILGLEKEYYEDRNMTYAIGTLVSVFSILVPFVIIWLCLGDKKKTCLNLGKPYGSKLMMLAIPIGMMVCMIGNFATNYISVFFEDFFGIVFESPDMQTPNTPLGIIAFFLQISVVPALVEEFAVRGIIMMPLRKYGNLFAVVVSSAIFGLMHGNLVQAPFAFIVGFGIGYLVITTGSMWTGVIIHFLNNFFSCFITLLYDYVPETAVNITYYAFVALFFISGTICTLFFAQRAERNHIPIKFKKPTCAYKPLQRFGVYMLNIPMILAIIYLIYITSTYISHV